VDTTTTVETTRMSPNHVTHRKPVAIQEVRCEVTHENQFRSTRSTAPRSASESHTLVTPINMKKATPKAISISHHLWSGSRLAFTSGCLSMATRA
jgi:hypothetical protein